MIVDKKTVVFDFDGVIHSYTSGWKGARVIPDPPVPGIKEAISDIRLAGYEVVVVSTRCATIEGHGAVRAWLCDNGIEVDAVKTEKPPAVVYIDDRAIRFDGKPNSLLNKIRGFTPWYAKPQTNADRIRAMSNEELADLFGQNCLCSYIQYNHSGFCESRAVCEDCIVEWLRQPADTKEE